MNNLEFSSSGNISGKNWNLLKGIGRAIPRIIVESFQRLVMNLFDTLFGFLNWPEKKLRVKILIMEEAKDRHVLKPHELEIGIRYARESLKKNFNVKLLPARNGLFVDFLKETAPGDALYTKGGHGALKEEFKVAGSFFAANLSGPFYPVTAFIVMDIVGATGCSLGPLTDYVTLDPDGARGASTLVHEIAHACGLWHVKERSNLLFRYKSRGDDVSWWQKNIFRGSRHVTYW